MSASHQPGSQTPLPADYALLTKQELQDEAAQRGIQPQGNTMQNRARLACSDRIIREICRDIKDQLEARDAMNAPAADAPAPTPAPSPAPYHAISAWTLTRRGLIQIFFFLLKSAFVVKAVPKLWTWMIRSIDAQGNSDLLVARLLSTRNMYNRFKWAWVLGNFLANVFKFAMARKCHISASWWIELGMANQRVQCVLWYLNIACWILIAIRTFAVASIYSFLSINTAAAGDAAHTDHDCNILAIEQVGEREVSAEELDNRPESCSPDLVQDDSLQQERFQLLDHPTRQLDWSVTLEAIVRRSVVAALGACKDGASTKQEPTPSDAPRAKVIDTSVSIRTPDRESPLQKSFSRHHEKRSKFYKRLQQRASAMVQRPPTLIRVLREELATLKSYHRGVLDDFSRILAESEKADKKLLVERQSLKIDLTRLTDRTRNSVEELDRAALDAKLIMVSAGKQIRRLPLGMHDPNVVDGRSSINKTATRNVGPRLQSWNEKRLERELDSLKIEMNSIEAVRKLDFNAYVDLEQQLFESQEQYRRVQNFLEEAWTDFKRLIALGQKARVVDKSQDGLSITLEFQHDGRGAES